MSANRDLIFYCTILVGLAVIQVLLVMGQGRALPPGDLHDLLKGPELWQAHGGSFPPWSEIFSTYGACDDYPPPLMLVGQLLFLSATGSPRLLPLLNLLFLAGFGVFFWLLVRRASGSAAALLALMMFFSRDEAIWAALAVGPEAPLMCGLAGLFYALQRWRGDLRRPPLALAAALGVALVCLTKVTAALHMVGPVLLVLWWSRSERRAVALFLGAALLLAAPWYLLNLENLLCYVGSNLSPSADTGHGDFLFKEFLPSGASRAVHALDGPLLAALVALVLLRKSEERPNKGTLFLAACSLPALLLIWAASAVGRTQLLELTVALPFLLALCAHVIVTRGGVAVRSVAYLLAGIQLVASLATFIPDGRLERALSTRPPGAVLDETDLHEGVVRAVIRRVGPTTGPVLVINKANLPNRVLLDPIGFWWAAMTLDHDIEFRCHGCREERYEMQRELKPAREPAVKVIFGGDGPADLRVRAGVLGVKQVGVQITR